LWGKCFTFLPISVLPFFLLNPHQNNMYILYRCIRSSLIFYHINSSYSFLIWHIWPICMYIPT
jgi:hypothetical protein